MRSLTVALALAIATLAGAQVKMNVVRANKQSGTVVITQKILKDGTKSVQLAMKLQEPERTVRTESTYTKEGRPLRKFQETVVVGQRYRRQITATFTNGVASIVIDTNGVRETASVPAPAGATLDNPSEYWFMRDKPKQGAVVKALTFDLEKKTWETVTVSYLGKKEIKLAGKKVTVHHTRSDKGSAYVDEHGQPVRLILPGVIMEKVG